MTDCKVGVAISTTGQRPEMLERAEEAWLDAGVDLVHTTYDLERAGVAVTKNRGIEVLMREGCEHLFLADDDMHPLQRFSITRYIDDPMRHLMLCWGERRRDGKQAFPGYVSYIWPRGVMLYLHRSVIEAVGGMRTEYPGFHEHVDLSRRVFLAGLTPAPYMDLDHDPRDWFHVEDMVRKGERPHQFMARKRRHSTIRRTAADKRRANELWRELDGDASYVEYRS